MSRYVSFCRSDGTPSFGRLADDLVVDLGGEGRPGDLAAALAAGTLSDLTDNGQLALDDVTLMPVIPNPGKILCVGLNYATHVKETGREQKDHPAIFTRWADTLVAQGEPLVRPPESLRFDYEGELAVVIGRRGRRIPAEQAMDYVAGYSIFNDASVRDWQRHNIQFTPGKNFPATGAFGPALVTPDEVGDIGNLRVQTRLNGRIVQDQLVADMIWDVPTVIAYCSTFTELKPGDVIATGTPGGVGDKRDPPLYMKAGDRVEVEVGVLGILANPIVDEA
ncbi:MAG: fumarylacetoacetate hydrolase family protein [Novosphingobium sp.]